MSKKTKCYSVRLSSLRSISDKCYSATAFDGSTALIPKSQVFGPDWDVQKSDAHWISAWILEQKQLQYSSKKVGWFNPNTGRVEQAVETIIEKHTPTRIDPVKTDPDASLTR